jgi:two-component system phosphate regulon response regulator PhoB
MSSTNYTKPVVLIVDPDRESTQRATGALTSDGFQVITADSGAVGLTMARESNPELVLLDMALDDISGTEVCRQLKADPHTAEIPVIFVTARDTEMDKVVGFELGATDYVTKPFSTRELSLRARAVLRRVEPRPDTGEIDVGNIHIDIPRFRVTVDDRPVAMTRQEFRLLVALAHGAGRVFTREELLDTVWGKDADVLERTVDAHIKGLRSKLGPSGKVIETVHGVGYRVRKAKSQAAERDSAATRDREEAEGSRM